MPNIPDPESDPLWDELVQVVRARDAVPPELIRMARESFTWRTVDAELAELVADSAEMAGALVRSGTPDVRLLTFSAGGLQLEIELLVVGSARRIVGELVPGGPARITVEHLDGTLTEDSDELGRFMVAEVPAGRIRVRCAPADGPALVTPWLEA
jgi:hypothetical protein